jgi:hypothetical protein
MFVKKTLAASGLLALMGAVAACGGGSSSTPAGAAGAPTAATTADFCATISGLSNDDTASAAAAKLQTVGTPAGIAADARHGFEVLVDQLGTLPADEKGSDLTQAQLEKGMSATDVKDVAAFTTYLGTACAPSTGSTPTAPPS